MLPKGYQNSLMAAPGQSKYETGMKRGMKRQRQKYAILGLKEHRRQTSPVSDQVKAFAPLWQCWQ